jgi:hypothetical protein
MSGICSEKISARKLCRSLWSIITRRFNGYSMKGWNILLRCCLFASSPCSRWDSLSLIRFFPVFSFVRCSRFFPLPMSSIITGSKTAYKNGMNYPMKSGCIIHYNLEITSMNPKASFGSRFRSKLRSIIPSALRDCSTYQFRCASLSELEFHE